MASTTRLFVQMLVTNKHRSTALRALCEGNTPATGGFPSQMASKAFPWDDTIVQCDVHAEAVIRNTFYLPPTYTVHYVSSVSTNTLRCRYWPRPCLQRLKQDGWEPRKALGFGLPICGKSCNHLWIRVIQSTFTATRKHPVARNG